MEGYTYDLGSTSFDKQFEAIEKLSWLPWVGHEYENSERRILIVAESHYVKGTNIESKKKETIDERLTTRQVVAECPADKAWQNNMFDNLHRCLFGVSNVGCLDGEKLWSNLAFYNFIQRPMDYNGSASDKERPRDNDFYDGWQVFVEIVKIIRPTDCLFVGVTAFQWFCQCMNECNIKSDIECLGVLETHIYGRKCSISVDGNIIPIIGIQHTSHHFSWECWHHFLMENASQMVRYLNNIAFEELLCPEKMIRQNVLTQLKKKEFKYYYVVGEKDIEFNEDDKLGWMQMWITLGRLRDDKQLDCVTIGCYGNGILMVETGIRKNPNINLIDTENKEWWRLCEYKDFSINNTTEDDIIEWLENNKVFKDMY